MANESSVPGRGRRHPRGKLILLAISASLSALIAVLASVGFGTYLWAGSKVHYIGAPSTSADPSGGSDIDERCARKACNYLLLGSDSREGLTKEEQEAFGTNEDIGGSRRSDTIVVVHTEPDQQQAVILSFPRDLWVEIPGQGFGKINSAFEEGIEHGGAQLVARTIKHLTGLQINHVMYVDLAGFEAVVDALGGVRMCVPTAMSDPLTGLDIQAGCQAFDGQTALAFVRTRHQPCDTIPDFARISRQQQFLRAVLAKLLSPGEILRLPSLVPAVFDNIVVDRGLNPAELAYLASRLNGVNTGAADFRVVPTTTGSVTVDGTYYSIVRLLPEASELFGRLREGRPLGELGTVQPLTPPSPAVIEVGVFDRRSDGRSEAVLTILKQSGFDAAADVQDSKALGEIVKGSVILFEPGAQPMADVVSSYLPGLRVVQAERGLPGNTDIAVVIGSRYDADSLGSGGPPPECP